MLISVYQDPSINILQFFFKLPATTNPLPPRRIFGELPKTARQTEGGQARHNDGG